MYLHTVEPKTAEELFNRLRETEKIMIRAANTQERLDYIRTHDFASDGPVSVQDMSEVKRRLDEEMTVASQSNWWVTQTWNI